MKLTKVIGIVDSGCAATSGVGSARRQLCNQVIWWVNAALNGDDGHEATLKDAGNSNNIALLQTQQTSASPLTPLRQDYWLSRLLMSSFLIGSGKPLRAPAWKPLSLMTAADWSQTRCPVWRNKQGNHKNDQSPWDNYLSLLFPSSPSPPPRSPRRPYPVYLYLVSL